MSEENKEVIRLSVRSLVEFVLRTGDLDNRRGRAAKDAMAEGSRIHRRIQKQMGGDYHAEVSLTCHLDCGPATLILEGRADGIFTDRDGRRGIDEIKGIYRDVNRLEEPIPVHKAQALCYGYMYAFHEQLDGMVIQLTYCNLESEEIRRFQDYYTFEQLETAVKMLVRGYQKWAEFASFHRQTSIASIQGLEFPYPYRPGQRSLVVSAYRAMERKQRLFVQAPTGIGKTLSVVFPAVRTLGEERSDKIFYLTAKTITRSVAEEAFRILRDSTDGNLCVSSVTLTAKERICPLVCEEGKEADCNPVSCPYAKGHFDRVNDAVYALITRKNEILREDIAAYAKEYRVCPFEMSLDVSNWTDAIICDYNYVFDPNVRLQRYFGDGQEGNYVFLIDEAHNLVERAREMYSATLCKEDFLDSARHYKERSVKLSKALTRCNKLLLEMKRECDRMDKLIPEDVSQLTFAVDHLYDEIVTWYEEHPNESMDSEESRFFFSLRDFLLVSEKLDSHYQVYTQLQEDGGFLLKLFCVDPSKNLRECLDQGSSALFFSATMLPVNYYKSLLSGETDDPAIYVPSPFSQDHRLLCAARDVTTRYRDRSEQSFDQMAAYIETVTAVRSGNYFVFCPSYAYQERLYEALRLRIPETHPDIQIICQGSRMSEPEREAYLALFHEERTGTLVGLGILGGIFSEGIDLREDTLIGVFIAGTGLPQVCAEREILKDYYEQHGKNGFDYAYLYPGMNKVQQAAGRLIRTTQDEGVIFLLDHRFWQREYQELFPREWADCRRVSLSDAAILARTFWEKRDRKE